VQWMWQNSPPEFCDGLFYLDVGMASNTIILNEIFLLFSVLLQFMPSASSLSPHSEQNRLCVLSQDMTPSFIKD
jgi:hypothetical protein